MAQQTTLDIPANDSKEITNADATELTFQNVGESVLWLIGTVGSNKPANNDGGYRYLPGQGELKVVLAELFLGVPGVNRVWVYSQGAPGKATSSHA